MRAVLSHTGDACRRETTLLALALLMSSNHNKLIHGSWSLSKSYYDQTELYAPFSVNPAKRVSKAKVNRTLV